MRAADSSRSVRHACARDPSEYFLFIRMLFCVWKRGVDDSTHEIQGSCNKIQKHGSGQLGRWFVIPVFTYIDR